MNLKIVITKCIKIYNIKEKKYGQGKTNSKSKRINSSTKL